MLQEQLTVGQPVRLTSDMQHFKAGSVGTVRAIHPDGAFIVVKSELIYVHRELLEPLS